MYDLISFLPEFTARLYTIASLYGHESAYPSIKVLDVFKGIESTISAADVGAIVQLYFDSGDVGYLTEAAALIMILEQRDKIMKEK